jgi:hypothetical protein
VTVGNVPFSVKRFALCYLQSHIEQVATKAHEFSGGLKVQCLLSFLGLGLKMNVSYMYSLRYQENEPATSCGSASDERPFCFICVILRLLPFQWDL